MSEQALGGLRVIDMTDDSGRFATKLLCEFGADVVRVSTEGCSGRSVGELASGGVLDWWFDGGKRRLALDLDSASGQETYRSLAERADLIVETSRPGRLAGIGLDHADLVVTNPALVQVSITPFGRTGPRADWVSSDLVSAAMGGIMSVTGTPDRALNIWGRQTHNYAGFSAVISALAAVGAARLDGRGRHLDLSIHEVVTGAIEQLFVLYLFDEELPFYPRQAQRQAGLHWMRLYDVVAARGGHMMLTPTPAPMAAVEWMTEQGYEPASGFLDLGEGLDLSVMRQRVEDLLVCMRGFVAERDPMPLWWEAQGRHVAMGAVHDIAQVAKIAQFEHRGFFSEADGPSVRMPGRLVRFSDTPVVGPRPPASEDTPLEELIAAWPPRPEPTEAASAQRRLPLEGVRVVDLSWVLAGPFCTRILGDLGADVIRVQHEARSTDVNRPDYPYFFVWNRSKRSATLNMKHPEALSAIRRLVENADVLVENYSAGVLDSWGLDWETMRSWNPGLIYVTMSGCGHDGPWRHVISYAPTVHAVCGITHLTNFADRGDVGAGFSLNDHLAGFAAASSVLAALTARERTGRGQKVDLAQLEVGAYAIGPALVEYFATGTPPEPAGNRDGLCDHVPNEVYRAADGAEVAVSVLDGAQWSALAGLVPGLEGLDDLERRRAERERVDGAVGAWVAQRSGDEAVEALQGRGVPAGVVQGAAELLADPQHRARGYWREVDHGVFGPRAVDAYPLLVDGERLPLVRAAPTYLGEHNFEVWTEVGGYEFDEVADKMGAGLFE